MKRYQLLIIAVIVGIGGYMVGRSQVPKYYDGEGNAIPTKAVDLLVTSQFSIMTPQEDSVINHYFYLNHQ